MTFFQLRLTRRVAGVAGRSKLVVAMLLMGLPFLLLSLSAAIPVVVLVIFLFVIGEMLWVPMSQSVVAGLAPEDLRGAYMGAFGGTAAMGFALAPFIGLQVGDRSATGRCGRPSPRSRSSRQSPARSPSAACAAAARARACRARLLYLTA